MQLVLIVGIGFGGYKLYQWAKTNPNINVSGKNVAVVIGIALLALVKWAYGNGAKSGKSSQGWMRSYRCKNCGRTIRTMFNPKETEKTSCSGGYQHQWQKID